MPTLGDYQPQPLGTTGYVVPNDLFDIKKPTVYSTPESDFNIRESWNVRDFRASRPDLFPPKTIDLKAPEGYQP